MGIPVRPGFDSSEQVDLGPLRYTAGTEGPSSAFKPLSVRKIDAGVTHMINARFNRIKPDLN